MEDAQRSALLERARAAAPVALAVLIASIAAPLERMRTSGFNSDDVAWVVGFQTWRPGSGTLVLVENTYLLHAPFLALVGEVLPSSPWSLFSVAVATQAVGLWLVVAFARHAIAEALKAPIAELSWKANLTAVAAVCTYQVLSPMARAANAGLTTRNLEAGIALLLLRWGYEYATGQRRMDGVRQQSVAAAVVAVVALNDPLVVVTLLLPALAVFAAAAVVDRLGGAQVLLGTRALVAPLVGGIVGWRLLRLGLQSIGVRFASSPEGLASPSAYWSHVRPVLGGLGQWIGRGLLRDDSIALRAVGAACVAVAVVSVSIVLASLLPASVSRRPMPDGRPTLALLALVWLALTTVVYFVSTAGASQASFRYVIVALPAIGISVAVAFATTLRRWQPVIWGLALAAVTATVVIGVTRDDDDLQAATTEAAAAIRAAADEGFDRGYSGYWSGPIVSYYSDLVAPVLAVQCRDGFNVPFELLQDLGQFDRALETPATRSFILVDRRGDEAWACPPDRLVIQHGQPDDIVPAGDFMELWLYDTSDVVVDVLRRVEWPTNEPGSHRNAVAAPPT